MVGLFPDVFCGAWVRVGFCALRVLCDLPIVRSVYA